MSIKSKEIPPSNAFHVAMPPFFVVVGERKLKIKGTFVFFQSTGTVGREYWADGYKFLIKEPPTMKYRRRINGAFPLLSDIESISPINKRFIAARIKRMAAEKIKSIHKDTIFSYEQAENQAERNNKEIAHLTEFI